MTDSKEKKKTEINKVTPINTKMHLLEDSISRMKLNGNT
jgi:hypothetical protein